MKANKLTPNFSVSNIRETVRFYQDILGFNLVMAVPESQDGIEQQLLDAKEYVYAMMVKDNVELMFQRTDSFRQDVSIADQVNLGASVSFYMEIDGVEEFYQEIKKQNVVVSDIKTAWYGMREFYVKDNNGYVLGFSEKTE